MPLPSTLTSPVAASLYPDRITIAYQYLLSASASLATLLPTFQQAHDFTSIRRGYAARAKVQCASLHDPIEVEVSRPSPKAPLRFVAYINPLRDLHLQRDDYGDERGRAAALNWLHPEDICDDNNYVAEHAHDMIMTLESVLSSLAEDAARSIRGHAELESIYVKTVEVAYDLAANDPEAMSHRLGQVIRQRFRNSITRAYRQSACGYHSLNNDTHVITGYTREGESYKTYGKTDRRVRIECEVEAPALKAMAITRDLARYPGHFPEFFSAVTERVLPNFLEILEVAPTAPTDLAGPLDLIADLARSIRSPGTLRDVLVALATSGRITRNFARRGLGSHLCESGVLERVGRGTYAISPRYREALSMISTVHRSWLDFSPAREEA